MGFLNWLFGKSTAEENDSHESRHAGFSDRNSGSYESSSAGGVALLDAPVGVDVEQSPKSMWWSPEGITQTEPVAPPCPDLSTEARALENLMISYFDGHDLTMPALLPVAERALSQLRDSECSLSHVARTISDDPVITAAVFRMSNSALYRGIDKITSLPSAVSRLGINALRTLMMHESMRAAMSGRRGGDAELASLLWRRSIASATIMRSLSRFTHVDEEDAFLAGLLHDIGNIIVLRIVEGEERATRELIDLETFEYLCHECHQEFGELVAQAWKLPLSMSSLVSSHHNFPASDDPQRIMRLQLILSDMINSMQGYAHEAQYDLLNSRAVEELGLGSKPEFVRFLTQMPAELESAVGES